MKKASVLFFIALLVISCNQKTTKEEKQKQTAAAVDSLRKGVYFVFPEDGATVSNPVQIGFGVDGMEVEPAGQVNAGLGHHHIIIDGKYVAEGVVVPSDSTHIHYGKGQIETKLNLTPGKHTLTMQFADGVHKSYGEAWSKTIEITVSDNK